VSSSRFATTHFEDRSTTLADRCSRVDRGRSAVIPCDTEWLARRRLARDHGSGLITTDASQHDGDIATLVDSSPGYATRVRMLADDAHGIGSGNKAGIVRALGCPCPRRYSCTLGRPGCLRCLSWREAALIETLIQRRVLIYIHGAAAGWPRRARQPRHRAGGKLAAEQLQALVAQISCRRAALGLDLTSRHAHSTASCSGGLGGRDERVCGGGIKKCDASAPPCRKARTPAHTFSRAHGKKSGPTSGAAGQVISNDSIYAQQGQGPDWRWFMVGRNTVAYGRTWPARFRPTFA